MASFVASDGSSEELWKSSGDSGAFDSDCGVVFVGDLLNAAETPFNLEVQSFALLFRVGGRQYIAVETGVGSLRPMPGS